MTKRQFLDKTYLDLALALDEACSTDGEIVDWAINSKYAQERVWTCCRLNKAHPTLKQFLLGQLYDTYLNSLLKRDVPKSLEILLRKVDIGVVAASLKMAL